MNAFEMIYFEKNGTAHCELECYPLYSMNRAETVTVKNRIQISKKAALQPPGVQYKK